jgi:hypothetical protein
LDGFGGGSGSAALAGGFEEDDGAGGGDVEGADSAGHGDAEKVVAGAADERVEASAFAAEDDDEVAGEIEPVVVGGAAFVETDNPEVLALEVFEGADEVDDAGDAEMLGCAGAGLDGGGAEGSGAALGEEDAVDAGAVGHAEERAEVLRVFDAVEREHEACGGGTVRRRREEVFEGEEFLRADEGDDALMRGGFGGESELLAGLLDDADTCLTALGEETVETGVMALAGNEDVVKAAAAGLEGFRDRVQAVKDFHLVSACLPESRFLPLRPSAALRCHVGIQRQG